MDLSIGWRRAALSRDPVSRRGSYRTTFGYHRNRERRARACLDSRAPEVALSGAGSSALQVVGRFVQAGIEHIFLGYDHIAFLAAIVLWAQRLWPVIKIVTAFTIAHSITLSLAALQIVVFPSAIVEPAIAATIIFVAVENFFSRNVDGRWRVAVVFWVIHGFSV